jgi:hypothetical protein
VLPNNGGVNIVQVLALENSFIISDSFYADGKMFYSMDEDIAIRLLIKPNKYQQTLIKKYKAYREYAGETYFNNIEDAEKALEWINSLELLVKLSGTNNG